MKFQVNYEEQPINGKLEYVDQDYSFDFTPNDSLQRVAKSAKGRASLSIHTLQIVTETKTKRIWWVWGYLPKQNWINMSLERPVTRSGTLYLESNIDIIGGIAYAVPSSDDWVILFDSVSGWIRLGPPAIKPISELVEFATNTAAEILDGKLMSLWLKPSFAI